jgi:hypothetical protein
MELITKQYKAHGGVRAPPQVPLFPSSPLPLFSSSHSPFPSLLPFILLVSNCPPPPPFGPHLRRLNLEGNCTRTQTTTTTTTNVQGSEETSQQMYDKMNEQMNALYKKHDCSPMKSVIAMMFQAPIMISVFLSLRKMAGTYPSMMTGGAYWFTVSCHWQPFHIINRGC